MFAQLLFLIFLASKQITASSCLRKLLMDEMCKRSDRDFPGLQALESVVDGILARAKEEKLKPVTLIDSWSHGAPPPEQKKKQCASWDFVVCFCMRLAVCNEWCCFSLGILQYFWLFWVRKPVFFVSLSQCEHSGSIFFVLQLIGFHTCKRYCLQEKEQYVWKSDRRNAYIYIVHYLFFSI